MKIPFHNRVSQTVPDAMHTIKVVVVHVFNVITGKEDSDSAGEQNLQLVILKLISLLQRDQKRMQRRKRNFLAIV